MDTFRGIKGDIPIPCAVTSFEKRNHHIVENRIAVIHSAEDCYARNMKLLSSKKSSTLYRLP